jgi:hypothetical protein
VPLTSNFYYLLFTVRSSYPRFVFEILKFVSYANLISQKEAINIGEETKIFKKISYFIIVQSSHAYINWLIIYEARSTVMFE